MRILHIVVWAQFFINLTAGASPTADLVQSYPAQVLRNELVDFKPIKDHHFSAEAPQRCGSGQVISRAARAIQCQFAQSGSTQAVLNVCDDKKTYCKPVTLELAVMERAAKTDPKLTKNQDLNHDLKHILVPDFLTGSPESLVKAVAQASKPVFVMVSTDWCPPCNEAKEYLLSSSTFKEVAAGWTKIYIDGDNLMAADWQKYVPYRYFPSFVLFNSNFEEVARYTGSIRQSEFAEWAKEAEAQVKMPIASLRKRVLDRLDGVWLQHIKDMFDGTSAERCRKEQSRLLKWALDKNDRLLIDRLIDAGVYPDLDAQIAQYKLTLLQEEQKKDGIDDHAQRVTLFKRLQDQTINRDGWAGALAEFCEYDAKACEPELARIPERIHFLEARPGVNAAERASLLGEEYAAMVYVYEALGKKTEQKIAARKCVEAYDHLSRQSALKMSRGSQQGMVSCLEAAGDFARAENLLKALVAAYPSEPTFLQRMARVLRNAKRPAAAMEWIQKAEAVAYGYNWFGVELIKADILVDLKRGPEAKRVLDEALSQLSLEPSTDSRNQITVGRLRAAQAKVESLKNP